MIILFIGEGVYQFRRKILMGEVISTTGAVAGCSSHTVPGASVQVILFSPEDAGLKDVRLRQDNRLALASTTAIRNTRFMQKV